MNDGIAQVGEVSPLGTVSRRPVERFQRADEEGPARLEGVGFVLSHASHTPRGGGRDPQDFDAEEILLTDDVDGHGILHEFSRAMDTAPESSRINAIRSCELSFVAASAPAEAAAT